jgi:dolichol kinase
MTLIPENLIDFVLFIFFPILSTFFFFCYVEFENSRNRFFGSAHSLIFILSLVLSPLISKLTSYENNGIGLLIFFMLLLIGYLSVAYSFYHAKKISWVHLLHVYNFLLSIWTLFVGIMFITHDWL